MFFHVSDHPGLENMEQIEKFQEKAYVEFQDYITRTYPDDTYRYLEVKYYLTILILNSFVNLFFHYFIFQE